MIKTVFRVSVLVVGIAAALPAMLRVDYVFSALDFEIKNSYHFAVAGPDHCDVLSDLEIKADD